MTDTQLKLDEPVRLHPLTYLEEGDDVTVGRADIDSYGVFPRDGAELVRRLEQGSSPSQAASGTRNSTARRSTSPSSSRCSRTSICSFAHGEEVALGPGRPVAAPRVGPVLAGGVGRVRRRSWWRRLSPWCADHSLVPRYQHLFFTRSSLTILTLGIVLGQVPWMLLHEAFHALAGRRLGLNSKLSIGRRFYYVVFVTSLDGLVAVPRRKRYLPMLAGMVLDVLAGSPPDPGAAALASTTRRRRLLLQAAVVHGLRRRDAAGLAVLLLPSHRPVLPGHHRARLQRPAGRISSVPVQPGQDVCCGRRSKCVADGRLDRPRCGPWRAGTRGSWWLDTRC